MTPLKDAFKYFVTSYSVSKTLKLSKIQTMISIGLSLFALFMRGLGTHLYLEGLIPLDHFGDMIAL